MSLQLSATCPAVVALVQFVAMVPTVAAGDERDVFALVGGVVRLGR